MSESSLTSVQAIIDAVGGTTALARLLNRSPQQADTWRRENMLPAWTYPALTELLAERGYVAPKRLWRKIGDA